ncbi:MAG: acyl-CoA dehydrogenase family protein [Myxococcales bacterium]|nr:acyl-CoA dehydrogenase family protein [Myxococcales bacterium]MDD9967669.1 acyl-CoA dehydrogenase family protein [Myxococcales bacterium]
MPRSEIESLDAFRQRARAFAQKLGRVTPRAAASALRADRSDEEELAEVARERELQRRLFDANLAGVCVPREYGGQGLTPAHQRVLNAELRGREYPARLQVPTFTPCLSVLLEFGSEQQKLKHVPAILRGDELWMQFLSEPSCGSDVAGALTTAVRDGDEWVLNGSKVWTTGAWWSDWGLCLARTNWDAPKHGGLTVFIFPIKSPGIEVQRIEMLNGSKEFCQEYLTDVRIPDSYRIGAVDEGWTVGSRWMFFEGMGNNSPLVTMPEGTGRATHGSGATMHAIAKAAGTLSDPRARELIGEAECLHRVGEALKRRIGQGIMTRKLPDKASNIHRLYAGLAATRRTTIAFELAGPTGGAWVEEDGDLAEWGADFLMRQAFCIGGGTTEMAANNISERVLKMPREVTHDRDRPFREVPRSANKASADE